MDLFDLWQGFAGVYPTNGLKQKASSPSSINQPQNDRR